MSTAELLTAIRSEIERLKAKHQTPTFQGDEYEEGGVNGYQLALNKLLSFLDTLEEKPVEVKFKPGMKNVLNALRPCNSEKPNNPEGLDEAAWKYTDSSEWAIGENLEHIDEAFKAGAEWAMGQK